MAVDAKCCPLCGEPNGCGISNPEGCWCFKNKVPAELLTRLPEAARGKSCVCFKCIKAFQADPKGFEKTFKLSAD
ncbi:MAG: cysteine-rich CWC family protein [Coraliomargarita sp.]